MLCIFARRLPDGDDEQKKRGQGNPRPLGYRRPRVISPRTAAAASVSRKTAASASRFFNLPVITRYQPGC